MENQNNTQIMNPDQAGKINVEIEFNSTTEAKIIINGREIKLVGRVGCWTLDGIKGSDTDATIGGIIASKLMSPMIDILQGWMPDSIVDPVPAWQKLTKKQAQEVNDLISP